MRVKSVKGQRITLLDDQIKNQIKELQLKNRRQESTESIEASEESKNSHSLSMMGMQGQSQTEEKELLSKPSDNMEGNSIKLQN